MREVCRDCKNEKKHSVNNLYCTKYGVVIRYGRTHCVSYDPKVGGKTYVGICEIPKQENRG